MARVQLCAAIPAAVLFATDGAAVSGGGLKLKVPQAGQLASINTTVYAASTGGGTISAPAFITNASGELPGYVEEGSWELTLGATVYKVEAVSGATVLALGSSSLLKAVKANLAINVKDAPYNAVGDGVADDTAAIQAAITAGSSIYFPAGTYKISAALTKSTAAALTIYGAGPAATKINQTADADCFTITLTGGGIHATVTNMTIVGAYSGPMTTGAAVRISGALNSPALTMRDVVVGSGGSCEFAYGVHMTNCAGSMLDNVTISGLGTITGAYLTATLTTGASAPNKFFKFDVYNGTYGVRVVNSTNLGVEGTQLYGCDLVAVTYGLHVVNSAASYGQPHTAVLGGHINASDTCLHFEKTSQVVVEGAVLYNYGSTQFVRVKDASFATFSANELIVTGAGDSDGFLIEAPTGLTGTVKIVDNTLALKAGGAKYAVKSTADTVNTVRIAGNSSAGGAGFASMGYLSASVVVEDNTPLDTVDHYNAISITGGNTLSVAAVRSSFVFINTPGGASTVTTISARRENETFTFACDSALVTLEHNAGILLKGGVNFTASPGCNITLRRTGGAWREIARTV